MEKIYLKLNIYYDRGFHDHYMPVETNIAISDIEYQVYEMRLIPSRVNLGSSRLVTSKFCLFMYETVNEFEKEYDKQLALIPGEHLTVRRRMGKYVSYQIALDSEDDCKNLIQGLALKPDFTE